jgi:hypothetical protein
MKTSATAYARERSEMDRENSTTIARVKSRDSLLRSPFFLSPIRRYPTGATPMA